MSLFLCVSMLAAAVAITAWVRTWREGGDDARDVLERAALGLGYGVLVGVEGIEAAGLPLTSRSLGLFWDLVTVAALIPVLAQSWTDPVLAPLRGLPPAPRPGGRMPGVLAGLLAVVVVPVVGLALMSPPSTWDAMTYHLPRVEHWIAQGSVAPYPTADARQIFMGPLPAFLQLHLRLGLGTDRAAVWPQGLAYLLCLVTASRTARDLGGTARTQLLAALVAATVPMAILQSSTAQTDLVAAWPALAAAGLCLRRLRGGSGRALLAAVVATVLALAAKATMVAVLAPFVLAAAGHEILGRYWRRTGILAACALVLALPLLPHDLRNHAWFGSFLGPPEIASWHLVTGPGPGSLLSNMLRNLALHLGRFPGLGGPVARGVEALHRLAGLPLNGAGSTFLDSKFGPEILGRSTWVHEDTSGNTLHLLLYAGLGLTGIAGAVRGRRPVAGVVWIAAGLWVAGWILFSALYVWQPWQTRLDLAWFIGAAPLAGIGLGRLPRRAGTALALVLVIGAVPFVLINPLKPVLSDDTPGLGALIRGSPLARPLDRPSLFTRSDLDARFAASRDYRRDYPPVMAALAALRCHRLALVLTLDVWEYPFWQIGRFNQRGGFTVMAEDVDLRPAGPDHGMSQSPPCAVVHARSAGTVPADSPLATGYHPVIMTPLLTLYVRNEPPPGP